MTLRTTAAAAVAALLVAAPAPAAEPETGEVGPAKPTATWTGSVTDPFGAYDLGTFFVEQMGPSCQPPACDTFTLTVKGGDVLTIKVTGNGAENVVFEVEDPDGETSYVEASAELQDEREASFSSPKPGEWIVRTAGTGEFDYKGVATVETPQPAAAPPPPSGQAPPSGSTPPPSSPAPAPAPPQSAPQPGAASSTTPAAGRLTVSSLSRKARSARRLRKGRSVAVAVATTAPLKNVTALLVPSSRRSQVLGSGRSASVARRGTVRLKLKKAAKRGRYVLLVSGIDAQGRRIVAQRAVTVTR